MLRARSAVLGNMIDNANGVMDLDVSTPVLKSLLQYIYTDRVDPLDNAQLLIKFADSFELPGLKVRTYL